MNIDERRTRWFEDALVQELKVMENLPFEKIEKPASPFFISLLKVASLVKGSEFLSADQVLNQVKFASRHLNLTAYRADYQWNRAMKMAKPRYPEI